MLASLSLPSLPLNSSSSSNALSDGGSDRLLKGVVIQGERGQGQRHVSAAVIQMLDSLPVFCISLSDLHRDGDSSALESGVVRAAEEAERCAPSLLFLPSVDEFWGNATQAARSILEGFLFRGASTRKSVFVLATCDDAEFCLFDSHADFYIHSLRGLSREDRSSLFGDLDSAIRSHPLPSLPPQQRAVEVLRKVSPPPARANLFIGPTGSDEEDMRRDDEDAMRILRIKLRAILDDLCKDRLFSIFSKSLHDLFLRAESSEGVTFDNLDRSQCPPTLMDLMDRVDAERYETVEEFRGDVEEMVRGIKAFVEFCSANGITDAERDQRGNPMRLVGRALAMRDRCLALLRAQISRKFELRCVNIKRRRARDGGREGASSHSTSASHSQAAAAAAAAASARSARLRGERPEFGFDPDLLDALQKTRRSSKSRSNAGEGKDEAPKANGTSHPLDCDVSPIHDPSQSAEISYLNTSSFISFTERSNSPKIILDEKRASRLISSIVDEMESESLDSLLELRARFFFIARKHERECDRTKMLEEMEGVLEDFRRVGEASVEMED